MDELIVKNQSDFEQLEKILPERVAFESGLKKDIQKNTRTNWPLRLSSLFLFLLFVISALMVFFVPYSKVMIVSGCMIGFVFCVTLLSLIINYVKIKAARRLGKIFSIQPFRLSKVLSKYKIEKSDTEYVYLVRKKEKRRRRI